MSKQSEFVYLVWQREDYQEYAVIMVTLDEEKAKRLTGQPTFHVGDSYIDSDIWYERMTMETIEVPDDYQQVIQKQIEED